MTINEVPTSTPVPRSVMMRSWRVERLKESGRMPARKELLPLISQSYIFSQYVWTHAMPITVLKASSINSPSHMLSRVVSL
jgi:hypothetical protein